MYVLYCDIQFGCHRSQTPAPSRNLACVTASHGRPPEALKGHKMIKNKCFFPAGPKHTAENAVCRNFWLVTSHNQLRRKVQFGAEVTGHTQRRIEYRSTVIGDPIRANISVPYCTKTASAINMILSIKISIHFGHSDW